MGDDYDFLFKILLVGDSGSGKTIILHKYTSDNNAVTCDALPSIGIDFHIKRLELESKMIKLQIWDTPGQERYKAITRAYFMGAHGVVFVFDVTNKSSFENIHKWFQHVAQYEENNLEKILLANNSDLSDKRTVTEEEAQRLAETLNADYFEVSCNTNMNIDEAFMTIAQKILNNLVRKEIGVGAGTEPQFQTNEKIGVGAGTEPQFQTNEKIVVGAGTEPQFQKNEKIGVGAGTEPQFQTNEKIGVGAGTEPQFQTNEKIGVGAGTEPQFQTNEKIGVGAGTEPQFQTNEKIYITEQRLPRKKKVDGGKVSKCEIQ